MNLSKVCPKCKETLGISYFHVNRSRPDGLDWRCKFCKKAAYNRVSQKRRDAARYVKAPEKALARDLARKAFSGTYPCSVLNCNKMADELHHVTYEDPLAVVPLCSTHHRLNHQIR